MKEYEKAALIYSLKESNTLVLRIILISILVDLPLYFQTPVIT